MGDKKNIDRLFQEQFKNFEVSPDDAIWENIQPQLEEDRSRKKIVPLWMKLGGISASLLLLVAVSLAIFSSNDIENEIVDISEDENSVINKIFNGKTNENVLDNKEIVAPVVHSNNNDSKSDLLEKEANVFKSKKAKGSVVVDISTINSESISVVNNVYLNNNASEKQQSNITNGNKNLNELSGTSVNNQSNNVAVIQYSSLLKSEKKLSILNDNDKVRVKEISDITNDIAGFEKVNTQLSSSNITDKELTKKFNDGFESIGSNNLNNIAYNNVIDKENPSVNKTNSITGKVAETELIENVLDNIDAKNIIASSDLGFDKEKSNEEECSEEQEMPIEKTIEEVVAELKIEEDKNKDEEDVAFSKWNITSNIAPVYYNTLSGGSPIDSELSANKKKGQLSMSYGLGVGYVLNNRLTIRTGLNKVELGYDTQDVAINSSPETSGGPRIKNINLAPEAASLNISSSDSFSIAQIPSSFSSLFNSSLNQRLGYLEVPLELSYKVSSKKIKIDVIAGLSTFFLNKNEIYTETNGKVTFIGEANNLNKMSYSTNIGLGFNYKIAKSFNFNFEPMFKYQLNTFSNDSGNFKPYILGVYSGFSFKF